jgi:secreted trypsin-like serine protease
VAKLVALLLTLAALSGATNRAFAGERNWALDQVRQHEAAVLQRMIGLQAPKRPQGPTPAEIVGGGIAPPSRWPFQVGLLLASVSDNYMAQFCGGSIIDREFILTAGHCAEIVSAADLHILTGTASLANGGTRREVKKIWIHPRYDGVTLDFDVALIQLKTKIPNLAQDKIADVITRAKEPQLAPDGTKTFVAGWGDTGSGFPMALREVSVPIVKRKTCNSEKSYDGQITPRMLCAGLEEGGKDSCQGDSGGPLVVKNGAGYFRMQAGIVSQGTGCALPNFYGIYTRLAVLEAWVSAKISALRAASASALACDMSGGSASSPACRRAAKDEAEKEVAAYLDVIKRRGTPAQASEAAATQRAWSQSLGGICAFEAAMNGNLGREDCVEKEARQRADALAGQLSDLPN